MKFKKLVSFFTIVCILLYLQGCTTRHLVTPQELDKLPVGPITVTTTDGEIFEFIEGWATLGDTVITGILKDGTPKYIPLAHVQMVSVEKLNLMKTCLIAGGVAGGVTAIWFIIVLNTMSKM